MKQLSVRQAKVCAWAHAYLHQSERWAVLDTETTGLSSQDEVIELALVDASGAVLFSSLIQTQDPAASRLGNSHSQHHVGHVGSRANLPAGLADTRSLIQSLSKHPGL
jgi:DNA polymerase III epsilon subunit-like protein